MIRKKDLKDRLDRLDNKLRIRDTELDCLEREFYKLQRVVDLLLDELDYESVVVEKHTKLEKKDGRD